MKKHILQLVFTVVFLLATVPVSAQNYATHAVKEGETLKTCQRIMAGQWDPWVRLVAGILAQYWEGLYRDTVQEIQARATAH